MKTAIVKYTTNEAEIAKMSDIYLNLTIDGIEDTEGFEAVHDARMIMVKHRTDIDKFRKKTNKDAQDFISTNNKNAKKLGADIKSTLTGASTKSKAANRRKAGF